MSNSLRFYFVPKAKKTKYTEDGENEVELTQEPLLFTEYTRSSDIYQAYNELNPVWSGDVDKYDRLTYEEARRIADDKIKDIEHAKKRLEVNYKMLSMKYDGQLYVEIQSTEEYIEEQEEVLKTLNAIAGIVYEIENGKGDFEKVLINVG